VAQAYFGIILIDGASRFQAGAKAERKKESNNHEADMSSARFKVV